MEIAEKAAPFAVGVVVETARVGRGLRSPNGDLGAGVPFEPFLIGGCRSRSFFGDATRHARPCAQRESRVCREQTVLVENELEELVLEGEEEGVDLFIVSRFDLFEKRGGAVG